jgi:hypothetical protein
VVILSGVEAVEAAGLGKMWTFDKVPLSMCGSPRCATAAGARPRSSRRVAW